VGRGSGVGDGCGSGVGLGWDSGRGVVVASGVAFGVASRVGVGSGVARRGDGSGDTMVSGSEAPRAAGGWPGPSVTATAVTTAATATAAPAAAPIKTRTGLRLGAMKRAPDARGVGPTQRSAPRRINSMKS
jgi:hypothetical protein